MAGSLIPFQSLVTAALVVAVLAALAWWLRRHGVAGRRAHAVRLETALPLGDRRSLVIVSVEGRRLLLGLTPNSVALVTELASFDRSLDRSIGAADGTSEPQS